MRSFREILAALFGLFSTDLPAVNERPVRVRQSTASPAIELTTASPVLELSTASPVLELSTASPVLELSTASPVLELSTASPVLERIAAERPDVEVSSSYPVSEDVRSTLSGPTTASGACSMPETAYVIQDALALGDMPALGYLQYANNLCGQVLLVRCGDREVEAVVADSCGQGSFRCGLDLVERTWYSLTQDPPGVMQCSVALTSTRAMGGSAARCFQRPDSLGGTRYYYSVGVFNTGGKLVAAMTLDGISGRFNAGSNYMDFSGSNFNPDSLVVASFTDGTAESFALGDCPLPPRAYVWG